jgi:DNA-directed RNA polymerase specialized sigma24 family protein
MDDHEVVAAIRSHDLAGVTAAYDKYAAALYGYCHWMLCQSADAAEALRDTFVIGTAPGDLPETSELRPWLYSVARRECLRRLRTTDRPTGVDGVDGGGGEGELRTLICAVLAGLKPRERELIELQFRHDLHDADLAIALGVSWGRAHALAARSRRRLERALGALLTARTGREAGRQRGPLRPAALSGLLPLAPLPPGLKEQVLRACSAAGSEVTAAEVMVYRRRVSGRAELTWLTRFAQAIRRHWRSIYRHKRPATITMVFTGWVAVVWAVAAVLFIFAGFR